MIHSIFAVSIAYLILYIFLNFVLFKDGKKKEYLMVTMLWTMLFISLIIIKNLDIRIARLEKIKAIELELDATENIGGYYK